MTYHQFKDFLIEQDAWEAFKTNSFSYGLNGVGFSRSWKNFKKVLEEDLKTNRFPFNTVSSPEGLKFWTDLNVKYYELRRIQKQNAKREGLV